MYESIHRSRTINPAELPETSAERGLIVADLGRQALELIFSEAEIKADGTDDVNDLTKRELEVWELLGEGLSNHEIGKRLYLGEQTIKFHLTNIYRKLNVTNRVEAGIAYKEHSYGRRGTALERVEEKQRQLKEAAKLLIRGGVILASMDNEGQAEQLIERFIIPSLETASALYIDGIIGQPNSATAGELNNEPTVERRRFRPDGTISNKLVDIIETSLGEPWDSQAKDKFAKLMYPNEIGASKVIKNRLGILVRSSSVQRRLANKGIHQRTVSAREYFDDSTRHSHETVWIFERDLDYAPEPLVEV